MLDKMQNKTFLFIGTRFNVLDFIISKKYKVFILLPNYLRSKTKERYQNTSYFKNKDELISKILTHQFDILISNGCPYILPINLLQKQDRIFINIHPSLLPSLKGPHPINGAIFNHLKTGATCHLINNDIDGGEIISQIPVYNHQDISLKLLYQLCFLAEVEAFKKALNHSFCPMKKKTTKKESYFKRNKEKMQICLKKDTDLEIIQKVKAFNIQRQYATLIIDSQIYYICKASIIKNNFLRKYFYYKQHNEICLSYNDCILLKRLEHFIEFTYKEYQ